MSALEKITKARAGLVLDHPFFGALALRQTLKEDDACETAWTDGKTIGYNPTFIDSLPLDQLKGLLAHEVMHVAAAHNTRRKGRDAKRWNQAGDYAINDILQEAKISLPSGAFVGMGTDKSAEAIYNLIPAPPPQDGKGDEGKGASSDQGGCGEVRDAPGKDGQPASEADLAQSESESKVATAQAAAVAKACGKLPAALARLVAEILEPAHDWKTELRRFLAQAAKNDYSWRRPNSRYTAQGLYLPALYSEEMPPIVIAVDTSGSIAGPELDQFSAEMNAIRGEAQAAKISVVYCDAEVQAAQTFEPEEPLSLSPQGGGGTSFVPPFAWVEENQVAPAALIYLTDGECNDYPISPDYPVLWAIIGDNRRFSPPFGEVIKL